MDKLATNLIDQIEKTAPLESPFLHYRIQNALQPEFYQQLCAAMPSSDDRLWQDHPNGGGHRKWIELDKAENIKALSDISFIWTQLNEGIRSTILLRKLSSKFMLENYRMNMQLIQDTSGYNIGPHCDTFPNQPHKMLTMILYLSDAPELKPHGTTLYDHHEKDGRHILKYHSTVPFVKNTMLLFKPDYPKTWHGVPRYNLSRPRISLQMFLKHR